jgi:hypothetical protein
LLGRHRDISVACNEDDRHIASLVDYPLLEFQTVEARKRNVKDETAWKGGSRVIEELLRGSEGLRVPAFVL